MGLQRVGHDFINNNNSCYRVWPRNGLGVPVTNGDAVPCPLMISKKTRTVGGGEELGGCQGILLVQLDRNLTKRSNTS